MILKLIGVSLSKVPLSKFILECYISQAHLDIQEAGQYRFILKDENKTPIGCVDLFDYDAIHRRAAIGIIIDKNLENLGYGLEAI